jgi:hypothetical protein
MRIVNEHFLGPMLLQASVSYEFCDTLVEYGNNSTRDRRAKLAGEINKEIGFKDEYQEHIHTSIFPLINEYIIRSMLRSNTGYLLEKYNIEFSDSWINYQQAYEYNPLHIHSGDISYVIYCDIPECIEKEEQITNGTPPGCINFRRGTAPHNRDGLERISNIFQDRMGLVHIPRKGDMFIFPASLEHSVTRFLSPNATRISVSGNCYVRGEIDGKKPHKG